MIEDVFQWLGAIGAAVAALLWVKSSVAVVPAPEDTSGVGALIGGYMIGTLGDKRIDLPATLELQSKWNARAAKMTALASILGAVALMPLAHNARQAKPAPAAAPARVAAPAAYPQFATTVPAILLGGWDEMVSDGCTAREARYSFSPTTAANFEVRWDVTRIKLLSPSSFDLDLATKDDEAQQLDAVWKLQLADNGQTLLFRDGDHRTFRKCPAQ